MKSNELAYDKLFSLEGFGSKSLHNSNYIFSEIYLWCLCNQLYLIMQLHMSVLTGNLILGFREKITRDYSRMWQKPFLQDPHPAICSVSFLLLSFSLPWDYLFSIFLSLINIPFLYFCHPHTTMKEKKKETDRLDI